MFLLPAPFSDCVPFLPAVNARTWGLLTLLAQLCWEPHFKTENIWLRISTQQPTGVLWKWIAFGKKLTLSWHSDKAEISLVKLSTVSAILL